MNINRYDASQQKELIKGFFVCNKSNDNYDRIYFSTNERLDLLFSRFDFRNKNILSVLASSDQLFYFLNNGAKKVDTFDKNELTIYYYYLRKWIIEFKKRYYPKVNIKKGEIIKIISKVKPKCNDEVKAIEFWKLFFNKSYSNFSDLFIDTSYIKANELKVSRNFRNKIANTNIIFNNIDISSEISLDERYDIIYTSNIADHIISDRQKFKLFRDNLYNLLRDDGLIISSNLGYECSRANEFGIFSEKFNYEILDYDIGYVYTKRCN